MRANDEILLLRGSLDLPLADEGTLSLWLRTDRLYQSGINEEERKLRLLEIEDYCSLSFAGTKSSVELLWSWDKSRGNTQYHDFKMTMPQFDGPN